MTDTKSRPAHDNMPKEQLVARIIVIADQPQRTHIDAPVLMDEEVRPDHLSDEHTSQQIIERVAWAVLDAQDLRMPRRQ